MVCLGSAQAIELDDTPCYLSALQDITVIRQAETERQRLEEQLRQSQKLEAIGTLAGGIAHDFNNILTVIMGGTDLAAQALSEDEPAQRYLSQVQEGNLRARDLVSQILTFSRQSESRSDVFDLRESLRDATEFLRATLPASIEIEWRVGDAPAEFRGDATQLQQVLMNLCTNAAHAMEGRGRIVIGLEHVELAEALQISSGRLPAGRYYRLRVCDTGHGIDPTTLDKIFDPFFTSKPAGEGTGLGLSVVHGIVINHGGGIEVSSELGRGSQFDVYLPVPSRRDKLPAAPTSAVADIGGGRLVIVDDEQELLALQVTVLEWRGHQVSPFDNARSALAWIEEHSAEIDLLMTDMIMPGMSGAELVERVTKIREDLPIVVVTGGSLNREQDLRELPSQVVEVLDKPFTPNELADCVGRVLTHSAALPGESR